MDTMVIDTSELIALANRLDGAPRVIQTELTEGMRESTQLVTQKARQLVTKRTGETARQISPTVRVIGLGVEGTVTSRAPWSRWLEEGRGGFSAKHAKALRFEVGGKVIFRKSVGPAAARPFMRPALRQSDVAVRAAFRRATKRAIEKLLGGA